MIAAHFEGWFQCRLATDPDPYDEPRGVSGYVHAYAGEPDLDRVLRWQPAGFARVLGPPIGVAVRAVEVDGQAQSGHPLVGAAVSLLDEPKFEGRNGVIADDGNEPIYPFRVRVAHGAIQLERAVVPSDPAFPYAGLFSPGVEGGPQIAREIAGATGIADLAAVWRDRLERLAVLRDAAEGAERVGLDERVETLAAWLAQPASPVRFFGARMRYAYTLSSPAQVSGWPSRPGVPDGPDGPDRPDGSAPWPIELWLGGWDADALCGYCRGVLQLGPPRRRPHRPGHLAGVRRDDRDPLMSGE
jgi:hypothetical protein